MTEDYKKDLFYDEPTNIHRIINNSKDKTFIKRIKYAKNIINSRIKTKGEFILCEYRK